MCKPILLLLILITSVQPLMAQWFYPGWGEIPGNKQSRLVWHAKDKLTFIGSGWVYVTDPDSTYLRYSGDHTWNTILGDWKFDEKTYDANSHEWCIYDVNGNTMTHEIKYNTSTTKYTYRYENGRVKERGKYITQNGNWIHKETTMYTYNPDGYIEREASTSAATGELLSGVEYIYTAPGQLLTRKELPPDKPTAGYIRKNMEYQQNKPKWGNTYYYQPTLKTWEISQDHWYEYDANGIKQSYAQTNYIPTDQQTEIEAYHYNAHGDIDTARRHIKDSVNTPHIMLTAVYNKYHQPLSVEWYEWDKTNKSWQISYQRERFHYFEFSLGVAGTEDHQPNGLTLYPIPAANTLHISLQTKSTSKLQLAITNTEGRLVQHWEAQAGTNGYQHTVDLSVLPPGNYMLTLKGADGNKAAHFSVVR